MDFRGRNIDLVGKWKLWFAISALTILVGAVSLAAFGLNFGIDFKGGGELQYRIPAAARPTSGQEAPFIDAVRDGLEKKGLRGTRIQVAGGDTLVVQTGATSEPELQGQQRSVQEVIAPVFKLNASRDAAALQPIGRELVGPVIGQELKSNAIKGVLLGIVLIAGWIYIRYNFAGDGTRYAVAGITALLHDVLVLLGIFALIGRIDPRIEVDGAFIAALLTVVGYSINDSVVIFDRLRENLRMRRREPFNKVVNDSLLETMSRSLNTGLTVIIMLLVLLFLGGESVYNFVLAMLIGIVSGLYSSIFNAAMTLIAWNSWDEKKKAASRVARPTARGESRGAARAAPAVRAGANASAPVRSGLAAASLTSGTSGTGAPISGANTSAPTASETAPTAQPPVTAVFADEALGETRTVIVNGVQVEAPVVATRVIETGEGGAPVDETTFTAAQANEANGTSENGSPKASPERAPRPSQKARAKRRH